MLHCRPLGELITKSSQAGSLLVLQRFTQNLAEVEWKAIKRVIKYLYTTHKLWLVLGGLDKSIEGYADADWALQLDRHSISGYAFRYGCRVITWSSKCQLIIVLSSTEAEYIAAAHTTKEIYWLSLSLMKSDMT
jgi:hypothetical protein